MCFLYSLDLGAVISLTVHAFILYWAVILEQADEYELIHTVTQHHTFFLFIFPLNFIIIIIIIIIIEFFKVA